MDGCMKKILFYWYNTRCGNLGVGIEVLKPRYTWMHYEELALFFFLFFLHSSRCRNLGVRIRMLKLWYALMYVSMMWKNKVSIYNEKLYGKSYVFFIFCFSSFYFLLLIFGPKKLGFDGKYEINLVGPTWNWA